MKIKDTLQFVPQTFETNKQTLNHVGTLTNKLTDVKVDLGTFLSRWNFN